MRNEARVALCILSLAIFIQPAVAADSDLAKLQAVVQKLQDEVSKLQSDVRAQQAEIDDLKSQLKPPAKQPPVQVSRTTRTPRPSADQLYRTAEEKYNEGNDAEAIEEIEQLTSNYPSSNLVCDARFLLAEISYRKKDFQGAIRTYNLVLDLYPSCDKLAAALLKKGLALLELGQRIDGIEALKTVIARYPKSPEALEAQRRLANLGV